MAAEAPYRGVRIRAPEIHAADVPLVDMGDRDIVMSCSSDVQEGGDSIDALILGVEVLIERQRGMMRHQHADAFLIDNELWGAIASLLTMVRTKATEIVDIGGEMEKAGQRLPKGMAA